MANVAKGLMGIGPNNFFVLSIKSSNFILFQKINWNMVIYHATFNMTT